MSNQNTLAIALAALLVGGVAMAAFQNNRTDAGSDMQHRVEGDATALAPARPELDYAQVLAAEPITEQQPVYAQVVSTEPIRETSTSSTPRQVCEDRVVTERLPERDGNVGGTVAGAVIGGLVGNRLGREVHDSSDRRNLATVGGAVAGGFIGRRIDRNHVGGQVAERVVSDCRTVSNTSTTSRTVGYQVTYRNADGTTGTTRRDARPGERLELGSEDRTIGWNVTYRYADQERTVRMNRHPGDRLPVLDGQVVIDTVATSDTQVAAVH